MKRPVAAALLTSFLLAFAGCAKEHEANEKYYLVSANLQLPYWKTAASGFFAAARQLKVAAETAGPTSYDPKEEARAFHRAVAQGATGILVSAADAELLKPEIDAAIDKGIPVIAIDADSPGSKRLFFIGTNNYQAGLAGGEHAAKLLNGRGSVVFYTMPGQKNLDERLQGYKEAFARRGNIRVSEVVDIKGDSRIAFDKTEELIGKKAPVDAYICLEASAGREVATVLERYKQKKVLIAMDTDDRTLDWLKKGWINATVAQKPYSMAFVGLKMLDDLHHRKLDNLGRDWSKDSRSPIPAIVDTGHMLVDKDNVDDFIAANKEEK